MELPLDQASAYRALAGRERRWDGRLYVGVASTGIYCRPSCPARTPRPENCSFYPTAAAAVAAGYRACRRCRPDALPGSRHWDTRHDLAARAVRLIADGVLDTEGVAGLARRLAVSERHLHRLLVAEVGAAPQQLGRTRRAHLARTLIEQTSMSMSDIAFAAGFGSIRQFNSCVMAEFGASPRTFRRPRPDAGRTGVGLPNLTLRLPHRTPIAVGPLRRMLEFHALRGVEETDPETDEQLRLVPAPGGPALARIRFEDGAVRARLRLAELSDLVSVVPRLRRWLDLDADPETVDGQLGADPLLAPMVARHRGLRMVGTVDPIEAAVMTVLGQQVSLAAARTFGSRLIAELGDPAPAALGLDPHWRGFPSAARLSEAGVQRIRDAAHLTMSRARAVHALAGALAGGLTLDPGSDPDQTRRALMALPGIGPWTCDYISLRCLHDPDSFSPGDLVARKAASRLLDSDRLIPVAELAALGTRWRPWRGYALMHLWTQETYR